MEKKYKNKEWYVSADSYHLMSAFTKELFEKGKGFGKTYNFKSGQHLGISYFENSWQVGGTSYNPKFHLPEDWQRALNYILEEETTVAKFKVGDFLLHNDGIPNLRYVREIKGDSYVVDTYYNNTFEGEDWGYLVDIECVDTTHHRVDDEKAIQLLVKHYGVKKGDTVGCKYWDTLTCPVVGFTLKKYTRDGQYSDSDHYNTKSQLAIHYDNGCGPAYISPDAEGFTATKIVKVAGYEARLSKALGTEQLCKIGCQWYTEDSLVTIFDILSQCTGYGIEEEIHLSHSKSGKISFTIQEIENALRLFK